MALNSTQKAVKEAVEATSFNGHGDDAMTEWKERCEEARIKMSEEFPEYNIAFISFSPGRLTVLIQEKD